MSGTPATGALRPVLILQHNSWEGPGLIGDALTAAGLTMVAANLIDEPDADLPALGGLAGVVVMGGPMQATDQDRHPGLAREADLVRAAVDRDLPVLGVCLGHQLIATALGATLHPGAANQVGLAPVRFTDEGGSRGLPTGETTVLHWHGDNVDAPTGATVLASSAGCPVQAFTVGSALGLQFHPELTPALLDRWLEQPEMAADLAAAVRASAAARATGARATGDTAANIGTTAAVESLRNDFAAAYPSIVASFAPVFAGFARRCADVAGITPD